MDPCAEGGSKGWRAVRFLVYRRASYESTEGPFPRIVRASMLFRFASVLFFLFFFFFPIVDYYHRTIASNLFEIITLDTWKKKKKLEKKIIRSVIHLR